MYSRQRLRNRSQSRTQHSYKSRPKIFNLQYLKHLPKPRHKYQLTQPMSSTNLYKCQNTTNNLSNQLTLQLSQFSNKKMHEDATKYNYQIKHNKRGLNQTVNIDVKKTAYFKQLQTDKQYKKCYTAEKNKINTIQYQYRPYQYKLQDNIKQQQNIHRKLKSREPIDRRYLIGKIINQTPDRKKYKQYMQKTIGITKNKSNQFIKKTQRVNHPTVALNSRHRYPIFYKNLNKPDNTYKTQNRQKHNKTSQNSQKKVNPSLHLQLLEQVNQRKSKRILNKYNTDNNQQKFETFNIANKLQYKQYKYIKNRRYNKNWIMNPEQVYQFQRQRQRQRQNQNQQQIIQNSEKQKIKRLNQYPSLPQDNYPNLNYFSYQKNDKNYQKYFQNQEDLIPKRQQLPSKADKKEYKNYEESLINIDINSKILENKKKQQIFTCSVDYCIKNIRDLSPYCKCKQMLICLDCFIKHLKNNINNNIQPTCHCGKLLTKQSNYTHLLTNSEKQKLQKSRRSRFFAQTKLFRCPKGCKQGVLIQLMNQFGKKQFQCNECCNRFCLTCLKKVHGGKCDNRVILEYVENFNCAICEECRRLVQRNGGCNKITCKCGYKFCYLCWGCFQSYSKHNKCPQDIKKWRKNIILEKLRQNQKQYQQKKSMKINPYKPEDYAIYPHQNSQNTNNIPQGMRINNTLDQNHKPYGQNRKDKGFANSTDLPQKSLTQPKYKIDNKVRQNNPMYDESSQNVRVKKYKQNKEQKSFFTKLLQKFPCFH